MKPYSDKEIVLLMIQRLAKLNATVKKTHKNELLTNEDVLDLVIKRAADALTPVEKLSKEFVRETHYIPWAVIVGFRGRIVHIYETVDPELVWEYVTRDCMTLYNDLKQIAWERNWK